MTTGPAEQPILIIEDDIALATEIADALMAFNYPTLVVHDWDAAMAAVAKIAPGLILMDQMLGRVDTLSRIHQIRPVTDAPIVMLTGNRVEADRIIALELGADDFLSKPISSRELLARVRAHLRRGTVSSERKAAWRIEPRERRIYTPANVALELTATEFELVLVLSRQVGEPISRDALSREVLSRPYRAEDRSIDNLIYQIRLKIRDAGGGDVILAARGRGYYFTGFAEA